MTRPDTYPCGRCEEQGTVIRRGEVERCRHCSGRGHIKRHPLLSRLPRYRLGVRR